MNAIETRSLSRSFGSRKAVDALSLEIRQGEVFALLGLNGAGKTTAIRMMSGLLCPTAGDAMICGHSITAEPETAKQLLNLSPQETAVAAKLTVRENLEFTARIYGATASEARQRADQALEEFGLTDRAGERAKKLSGGMQRRLSLAMALITGPKIVFLDEPTLGLDIVSRRELWKIVRRMKGELTVVLTTHYLEEAEALADRVGIMAEGRLCALGTPQELIARSGAERFEDAFLRLTGSEAAK